jgi:hypothetical protein
MTLSLLLVSPLLLYSALCDLADDREMVLQSAYRE